VSGLSEPGFEEKNAQSSSDAFVRKFGERWTVDGQPSLKAHSGSEERDAESNLDGWDYEQGIVCRVSGPVNRLYAMTASSCFGKF